MQASEPSAAVAPVEGDGVEDVAGHPELREHQHALDREAALGAEVDDRVLHGPGAVEVVAVAQGDGVPAVDREQLQLAVELGQLVEVEQRRTRADSGRRCGPARAASGRACPSRAPTSPVHPQRLRRLRRPTRGRPRGSRCRSARRRTPCGAGPTRLRSCALRGESLGREERMLRNGAHDHAARVDASERLSVTQ